jgi:hypothetical protein
MAQFQSEIQKKGVEIETVGTGKSSTYVDLFDLGAIYEFI